MCEKQSTSCIIQTRFLWKGSGLSTMIPEQLLHEAYVMNMIQRIPNLAGEIVQQQKDLKIPDFDNVMITNLKKIGFKDPLPIILAEGKKHVWFIDIKNRKTVYPMKDAEKFEEAADF